MRRASSVALALVAAGGLLFSLGFAAGGARRASESRRAGESLPRTFSVSRPEDGVRRTVTRLRVVRYSAVGGEPVDVSAPAGNSLWRFDFGDHAVYAEAAD